MKTIKFTYNTKEYSYQIISYAVWENKNILTVMMEDCTDNLFKWIKNNKDNGAKQYTVNITIQDNDIIQTFNKCSLKDFSYSSTLNAYTINIEWDPN